MFKQYHTIVTLRCAVIALLLATGVEGLKEVVLHNPFPWSAHIARIFLLAFVVFVLSVGLLSREKPKQGFFFEDTLRNFPETVCIVDAAGRFTHWNLKFEQLLGYTAREITKLTVRDTIAEEQREAVEQANAAAFAFGSAELESVLMCKDGTRIPCLFTGVRVVLNDQPCLLGIAVDLRKLRETEDNLRAREEVYRSLIESIPEVVWQSDAVGKVSFVGPGIEMILGYSPAEVYQLGVSVWYDSIHIDDRQRVKQAFESLLNEGNLYDIECRVQRRNGEWRWVHDRAVTTGEKGGIRYATGLLSDITERRGTEEALQRLAAIVDHSQDAIIGKTLDGVITSWNRAAEKMYGYTMSEAVGRNISFLLRSERQAEMLAIMERVRKGLPIDCFETARLNKAGCLLDVSLSISPIMDTDGRVTGASTIARDITLRKRSDEQLKLQSAALESAANGIVITDEQGTIVWVNRAVTDMTGYSKQELLGKNPRVLKSGDQPEDYYADLWATVSSGKVWRGDIVNRRKDGTTYTEEMTITPVTLVGTPVKKYFIAIKQDITKRKRAEKLLQQGEAMLDATGEMAKVGGWELDLSTDELTWTREVYRIHEVDEGFTPNVERAIAFYTPECRPLIEQAVKCAILHGEPFDLELEIETAKNKRVRVKAIGRIRTLRAGTRTLFGTFQDITERTQSEAHIQYLAYNDALTDLPNRTLLQDRLATALASARRRKEKVALLFLDLDRFKCINDSLGHSVGDLLLQEVAERLKNCAREQDTVARLGGDEFLIVLNNVKDISGRGSCC